MILEGYADGISLRFIYPVLTRFHVFKFTSYILSFRLKVSI